MVALLFARRLETCVAGRETRVDPGFQLHARARAYGRDPGIGFCQIAGWSGRVQMSRRSPPHLKSRLWVWRGLPAYTQAVSVIGVLEPPPFDDLQVGMPMNRHAGEPRATHLSPAVCIIMNGKDSRRTSFHLLRRCSRSD